MHMYGTTKLTERERGDGGETPNQRRDSER